MDEGYFVSITHYCHVISVHMYVMYSVNIGCLFLPY